MLSASGSTVATTITSADEAPSADRWRLRLVVGVVAVVAIVVAVNVWGQNRSTSPEQFAAFAQRLATLPAPVGAFTPYNPVADGSYSGTTQASWSEIGTDTWSNTGDRSWWVAVRGWQTSVTEETDEVTCRALLDWLVTTGSQLGLPGEGRTENLSTCMSVIDRVRSTPGSASDVWPGRGTQTADAQPRYRTGIEAFTGDNPGVVVLRAVVDATVAHG